MAGMGPKRQWDRTWVYPPIGAALTMVGLDDIGVYISLHHIIATQYIATYPIMDFCLAAERKPVLRLSRKWWEKTDLDIPGISVGHVAAEVETHKWTEEMEGEGE